MPENTMAAFLGACDLGVDGIEFDVHQTSDGSLVVIHDYDLGRTTDGSGLVHEHELSYVRPSVPAPGAARSIVRRRFRFFKRSSHSMVSTSNWR